VRMLRHLILIAFAIGALGSQQRSSTAAPTVTLRNGVKMPMISAGVYQYNETTAQASVTAALKAGFTALDNALDYHNQRGVGRAIAASGVARDKVFVETKVPGCANPLENTTRNPLTCYKDTATNLQSNLEELDLPYVDLVLLHFPPFPSFVSRSCSNLTDGCNMARQQWKAMEEFYKAGKAKAIGVSNYCPSCFACLEEADVFPMVNQVMYHLGSGVNAAATTLVAFDKAHGVQTQAYSTLGNTPWTHHASEDILKGVLTTSIAKAHNVSTVQVALKWVVQQGIPAVTKSSNPAHLASDLDLWSWDLTDEEMSLMNAHKSDTPAYPSYACNS